MHCSKINHSRALMSAIPLFKMYYGIPVRYVVCTLVFVRRSTGRRLIATCVVYSSIMSRLASATLGGRLHRKHANWRSANSVFPVLCARATIGLRGRQNLRARAHSVIHGNFRSRGCLGHTDSAIGRRRV